jgi:hypothetical protein
MDLPGIKSARARAGLIRRVGNLARGALQHSSRRVRRLWVNLRRLAVTALYLVIRSQRPFVSGPAFSRCAKSGRSPPNLVGLQLHVLANNLENFPGTPAPLEPIGLSGECRLKQLHSKPTHRKAVAII